jgi:uncharacterized protein involved in exopolysaccharide biosynthesis
VALEYARKLREVKYFESMFEVLAKQVELAKIDEAKDSVMVQVLDAAVVPDRKSKPRRTLIVLIAMIAGFVVAAGRALFKEVVREAAQDPHTAQRLRTLRALASWRGAR